MENEIITYLLDTDKEYSTQVEIKLDKAKAYGLLHLLLSKLEKTDGDIYIPLGGTLIKTDENE